MGQKDMDILCAIVFGLIGAVVGALIGSYWGFLYAVGGLLLFGLIGAIGAFIWAHLDWKYSSGPAAFVFGLLLALVGALLGTIAGSAFGFWFALGGLLAGTITGGVIGFLLTHVRWSSPRY